MTLLRRLAVAAAAFAFGRLLRLATGFRRKRRVPTAAAPVVPAADEPLPAAGALVRPAPAAAVAATAILPEPPAAFAPVVPATAELHPSAEALELAQSRESGAWSLGGEAIVDDEEVAEAYRAEAREPHPAEPVPEHRPPVAELTATTGEFELASIEEPVAAEVVGADVVEETVEEPVVEEPVVAAEPVPEPVAPPAPPQRPHTIAVIVARGADL